MRAPHDPFGLLLHLGHPAYFATILGTWKVLGAIALLVPGHPRVKERARRIG